jgi:hypothetical protein
VEIEPRLARSPTILLLCLARQSHQHDRSTIRLLPDPSTNFMPVQLQQPDVPQHDIGFERRRRVQRRETVVRVSFPIKWSISASDSSLSRLSSTTRIRGILCACTAERNTCVHSVVRSCFVPSAAFMKLDLFETASRAVK